MILITNISEAIISGASDIELNNMIAEFIAPSTDVSVWRTANYSDLRRWAYPAQADYLDAQVKIASGNPEMAADGQRQLEEYESKCLAVKVRFPK